ncbi:hypothetical protein LINPERPRIM_LOCUS35432 [Linum perenne]
MLIAAKAIWL